MFCSWCRTQMGYVHGHAACLDGRCPMFGLNQAECCDGETAATCPAPSASLAGRPTAGEADRSLPLQTDPGIPSS